MQYFQALFQQNNSAVIEYEGITYRRFWPIQVNSVVKFKLRFLHRDSKFLQAIVLALPCGFNGKVSVMGSTVPIKKAFPMVCFWEDTAPREFNVEITNFQGELQLCNGSDPIGTKQFCKHLSEGCAMIAQKTGDRKYRFYCHDHEYGGTCDNLVFELEILN